MNGESVKKFKIVWMDGKVAKCRHGVRYEFMGTKPLLINFYESEDSEPYIIGSTYLVAIEPEQGEAKE